MNKLIVNRGTFEIEQIDLPRGSLSIGREEKCDIYLDDLSVSSHHAKLVTIMNGTYIEDLGSTNGVSVNGDTVRTYFLRPGDIISIGVFDILYKNISTQIEKNKKPENRTLVFQTNKKYTKLKNNVIEYSQYKDRKTVKNLAEKTHPKSSNNTIKLSVNNLTTAHSNNSSIVNTPPFKKAINNTRSLNNRHNTTQSRRYYKVVMSHTNKDSYKNRHLKYVKIHKNNKWPIDVIKKRSKNEDQPIRKQSNSRRTNKYGSLFATFALLMVSTIVVFSILVGVIRHVAF